MDAPLVIGGPSGVGKSCFSSFLEQQGWLYLEADQVPKDGINELGLRIPWDQFWNFRDAELLAKELKSRQAAKRCKATVLSLPSCAVPTPDHLTAAETTLRIRFLYGDPRLCLKAFLDRERATGRNLPATHWDDHNKDVFRILSTSVYHSYLVDVFHADGTRHPWDRILINIVEPSHFTALGSGLCGR
jgi:hypothetical protein